MTTMNEDIKKLLSLSQRLTSLLEQPEPGIFSWNSAVCRMINEMHDVIKPTEEENQ